MIDKFKNLDPALCDKLFNFIYPDESKMTDEEVQAELQRLKIDTTSCMNKIRSALQKAVEKEKAQQSLIFARQKRLKMTELFGMMNDVIERGREDLKKWIAENLTGTDQAVFCRRLEETSDKDLKSLAEDILKLKKFNDSFGNEK